MSEETNETTGEVSAAEETVAAVSETAVDAVETVADVATAAGAVDATAAGAVDATAAGAVDATDDAPKARGRRQEKIGIVTSDKMQKTVVVRVDRLVMHPVYKRYVRRRARFMAHNEVEGVGIGDQVRIAETRPLSARKRWRVVEVLRKAAR